MNNKVKSLVFGVVATWATFKTNLEKVKKNPLWITFLYFRKWNFLALRLKNFLKQAFLIFREIKMETFQEIELSSSKLIFFSEKKLFLYSKKLKWKLSRKWNFAAPRLKFFLYFWKWKFLASCFSYISARNFSDFEK